MSEVNTYVVDCNALRKNDKIRSEVDVFVVLESDYDAAKSELAALREELATTNIDLSIEKAARTQDKQRLADAERRNVDQSNYLREALKRINVNQHHAFCLALADLLTKPEEAKS